MCPHHAASFLSWSHEPLKSSPNRAPLSARRHPPGRTGSPDDHRHESSQHGQWQFVLLSPRPLQVGAFRPTASRRGADRIRMPAPVRAPGRPRPWWRHASPRAAVHGWASGLAAMSTRPEGEGSSSLEANLHRGSSAGHRKFVKFNGRNGPPEAMTNLSHNRQST